MEILRSSGNKSRTGTQPAVRKGETDFLYCPSAPATMRTVTIEGTGLGNCIRNASKNDLFRRSGEIETEREKEGHPLCGAFFISFFLSRDARSFARNCPKSKPHPLRISVARGRFCLRRSLFPLPRRELRLVVVDIANSSSPTSRYFYTAGHRCL